MNQQSFLEIDRMIPLNGKLIPEYTWRHYMNLDAEEWIALAGDGE